MNKLTKNTNIIEFAKKLSELEREYNVEVVSEDRFCGLIIKDNNNKKIYGFNGCEVN